MKIGLSIFVYITMEARTPDYKLYSSPLSKPSHPSSLFSQLWRFPRVWLEQTHPSLHVWKLQGQASVAENRWPLTFCWLLQPFGFHVFVQFLFICTYTLLYDIVVVFGFGSFKWFMFWWFWCGFAAMVMVMVMDGEMAVDPGWCFTVLLESLCRKYFRWWGREQDDQKRKGRRVEDRIHRRKTSHTTTRHNQLSSPHEKPLHPGELINHHGGHMILFNGFLPSQFPTRFNSFLLCFLWIVFGFVHLVFQDLEQLAAELRADIVQSVSKTGGHLSSSLGVVELTVALHHVFNTPEDKIIWDVGHQVRRFTFHTQWDESMCSMFSVDWYLLKLYPVRYKIPL